VAGIARAFWRSTRRGRGRWELKSHDRQESGVGGRRLVGGRGRMSRLCGFVGAAAEYSEVEAIQMTVTRQGEGHHCDSTEHSQAARGSSRATKLENRLRPAKVMTIRGEVRMTPTVSTRRHKRKDHRTLRSALGARRHSQGQVFYGPFC